MAKYAQQVQADRVQRTFFSRSSTLVTVGLVCLISVVGCNKKTDSEETKTDNDQTETSSQQNPTKSDSVTLEPVAADAKKICADESLQSSLQEALVNSIAQQSKAFAAGHAQGNNVTMNMDAISKTANKVAVDVKNVEGVSVTDKGMITCEASVTMTLPSDDINRAEKMYALNNQGTLEQRMAQSNITINNGMISDDKLSFLVNPQSARPEAKLIGQPAVLQAVADVVANSSVKSQIDAAAARKRAQQKKAAEQAAARKRAQQKKAAEQAAAKKRAEQAAAKKRAQQKKAAEQAAARKRAQQKKAAEAKAQQNLSLEQDGEPNSQAKPSASTEPKASSPVLKDSNAKNIEMVIVEEEGTY